MTKTGQKTKSKDFLNSVSFDEVYAYYILENHSKKQCIEHFNTTERIFRAFLEHYRLQKPKDKVYSLISNTKEIKYGDANYNNREKSKQTCLARYGNESPLENFEIWQKTYNTTLNKFGGTGFANMSKDQMHRVSKKANIAMWEKYNTDASFRDAYQASQNKTKKENKTFNTSNKEIKLYSRLKDIYGEQDVIFQYRDVRYPYNCDFYIKSLDLFIELNAHWTHGEHPFDATNDADIQKLFMWQEKAKTSKFFQNAIETWTNRDVEKLKVLKENNLNFVLIYNKMEVASSDDFKH